MASMASVAACFLPSAYITSSGITIEHTLAQEYSSWAIVVVAALAGGAALWGLVKKEALIWAGAVPGIYLLACGIYNIYSTLQTFAGQGTGKSLAEASDAAATPGAGLYLLAFCGLDMLIATAMAALYIKKQRERNK